MNTLRQSRGWADALWIRALAIVAGMSAALAAPQQQTRSARSRHDQQDTAALVQTETLFVQALCDDSNLEVDWLWLATQVVREHERRFCLQRALRINPCSVIARRELAALPAVPIHMQRLAGCV